MFEPPVMITSVMPFLALALGVVGIWYYSHLKRRIDGERKTAQQLRAAVKRLTP